MIDQRGPTPGRFRIGVDVGGTFTDAILLDEGSGEWRIAKVPSTPSEPAVGFMNAVRKIVHEADVRPAEVSLLVHGSTVATNAIIEGKTARTAFITTSGFRDMLEIARQMRPALYDLQFEKPRPLVPRHLAFEVPERLAADGSEVEPLSVESARRIAARLRDSGVESIAVCLLHSYANSAHERALAEILAAELPEVLVSISADVAPEIREYFRASTTVVNAAIRPLVGQYLSSIRTRLDRDGFAAEALVMQSNGGTMSFVSAAEKPVFMLESGPAAGVVAASHVADVGGFRSVISFDMGGTTAKVGLVRDSTPVVTKDFEVGAQARPGIGGMASGSGYPIRAPVIELVEIGAGGGSIARVDQGGSLRVGPESAGADPGPACYGRGGILPTVTDANLVLGRLNPLNFLGGDMGLDVDAAVMAIEEHCAHRLNIDVVEAAHGIVEIANVAMTNAIRLISVSRGYDPREYALVAFGGAGPLHACRLAGELEIPLIIVPPSPGTASALGLLVSDLRHDYSRTLRRLTEDVNPLEIDGVFADMQSEARIALTADGITHDQIAYRRYAEMRYAGQSYELTVELPAPSEDGRPLTQGDVDQAVVDFHRLHAQMYGHAATEEPTMIVNVRLTGIGQIARPDLRLAEDARTGIQGGFHRDVFFAEAGCFVDTPTILRHTLRVDEVVPGPAVIEEMDSTTIVHPGYSAKVDPHGNLHITPSGGWQ